MDHRFLRRHSRIIAAVVLENVIPYRSIYWVKEILATGSCSWTGIVCVVGRITWESRLTPPGCQRNADSTNAQSGRQDMLSPDLRWKPNIKPSTVEEWADKQRVERDVLLLYHQLADYSYIMGDLYYGTVFALPYWDVLAGPR